jgi:hypothetical protein
VREMDFFTQAQSAARYKAKLHALDAFIEETPLICLALAVGAGFIVGGGASTRVGRALLSYVASAAARETARGFLADLIRGSYEGHETGFADRDGA